MSVDWDVARVLVNYSSTELQLKFLDALKDLEGKVYDPAITINDIPHKLTYEKVARLISPNVSIPQRRTFLSDIEFLTLYYSKHEKSSSPIVVYAGSSSGNHLYFLHEMFPNVKWVLIDPMPCLMFIDTIPTSYRCAPHPKIIHLRTSKTPYSGNRYEIELSINNAQSVCNFIRESEFSFYIIEDLMTIELAKILKNTNCLLISDIRTNSFSDYDVNKNDLDILWNNIQQFNWVKIMEPQMYMVKFRSYYYVHSPLPDIANGHQINEDLEYAKKYCGVDFLEDYENKISTYLKGKFHLLCFSTRFNTETKLIGEDHTDNMTFSNIWYESRMFYFNAIYRSFVSHKNPMEDPEIGRDQCNDCAKEAYILKQYYKIFPTKRSIRDEMLVKMDILSTKKLLNPPYMMIPHGTMFGLTDEYIDRVINLREFLYKDADGSSELVYKIKWESVAFD